MTPIKVVIVEDLEEVVEGLTAFMQHDEALQLLGTYRTAEAALLEVPLLKPDIILMDINLPGISGIECVARIKQLLPALQIMMFTVYENNEQVFEALKAGASGYLLKKTAPAQIISSIKELYEGGSPMSASIARKLVAYFQDKQQHSRPAAAALLTNRELEVLDYLSRGLLYKEIADQLHISFHTVRQHIGNIYSKLHVQNKTEAINKVYGNGQ